MNYWLLLIPVISAGFGWLGSRIAGKILIHRVFPGHKARIAEKIGKAVNTEFSFSVFEKKIADPANIKKIMPLVEDHIDDFLRHKLKDKMPVIGFLIGDKTINSLKQVFMKEIEDLFPQVLKQFAGNLQSEMDIGGMVASKITAVSPAKLENAFSPLLRYFCFAGSATGFAIGLINIIIYVVVR